MTPKWSRKDGTNPDDMRQLLMEIASVLESGNTSRLRPLRSIYGKNKTTIGQMVSSEIETLVLRVLRQVTESGRWRNSGLELKWSNCKQLDHKTDECPTRARNNGAGQGVNQDCAAKLYSSKLRKCATSRHVAGRRSRTRPAAASRLQTGALIWSSAHCDGSILRHVAVNDGEQRQQEDGK